VVCWLHQWGSDCMSMQVPQPEVTTIEKAIDVAKAAQIADFIRKNQILTAVALFVLWQAGAFVSALGYIQGGMC